jgi:rhodanese-related sulfurtransferase
MSSARRLGIAALALGVAAPFAGDPQRSTRIQIDVDALAAMVAREEDHVTALELAAWIHDRKSGLRVIDVRTRAEYQTYAIPGAEHLPLTDIARGRYADGEVLVLYSEGGAHAAQAWVFLRAMGMRQVYFLRGGLQEWMEDVMHPLLAADASPEAMQAFAATAELSRYFGGSPGIADAAESAAVAGSRAHSVAAPARTRRRGC